jgi:hypothetical protein
MTAIERASGEMFRFTVKDDATFKTAKLCENFDAPIAEPKKDAPLAADVSGAGKALGVTVILTKLKRTAEDIVPPRAGSTATAARRP